MNTTVTVRHTRIAKDLKLRAVELVDKVARKAHRAIDASIVFDKEHNNKIVEIRLHLPQGNVKVATGEGEDFRTALDRSVEKLQHQLDKGTSRVAR